MIALVYGLQVRLTTKCCTGALLSHALQAIIFILKREFMLIGWMVVYILS